MENKDNLKLDVWLSELLEKKVYRLSFNDECPTQEMLSVLEDEPCFAFTKIPTIALPQIHFLEKNNFQLVDTNVSFSKDIVELSTRESACTVTRAQPENENDAVEVASNGFTYSRFHLDPKFSKQQADLVKAEWVRNFFKGKRGDEMFLAHIDGKIAGFLQMIQGVSGLWSIDLIAVSAEYQRMGVAQALISFAENQCSNIKSIQVGTQIANIPSMRFYESQGFRVSAANYIFHYHS